MSSRRRKCRLSLVSQTLVNNACRPSLFDHVCWSEEAARHTFKTKIEHRFHRGEKSNEHNTGTCN